MKRAMAVKTCKEPATGFTIHAGQVIDLSDEDFDMLSKQKVVAETDEDLTQDVGALAMRGKG